MGAREQSAETAALDAALRFDPLAEAERITNESYKDDSDTMMLGIGLALLHNERKADLLRGADDSYYGIGFGDMLALLARMGFEEVLRDAFAGRYGPDEYVVLWHQDGLLATCESFDGRLNTAKVLYNYRHDSGGYPGGGLTSSGGMRGEVWVGDHDAREGIRHNLGRMYAAGRFLDQWVERPFLWLLTYADSDVEGYDHQAITERRIARLPEQVRERITPPGESGDLA